MLLAGGGLTPERMQAYREAGATGFGLDSALHAPDMPLEDVSVRAAVFVSALNSAARQ